jgi:predicted methyltransferase
VVVGAFLALTFATLPALIAAQESEADLERQNRVADLLNYLDAHPGAVVADVGAGDGFYTVRIARAVAPNGRAVAVDISESALDKLRQRVARENAAKNDLNIAVVLGGPDDPHLVAGSCDAVLIHNAYHEMTEHEAMLTHIRAALRPGGRLVVVEPMHLSSVGLTRQEQVAQHDIAADIVEGELRAASLEVVERDDKFITFTAVPGGLWLIVARRPAKGSRSPSTGGSSFGGSWFSGSRVRVLAPEPVNSRTRELSNRLS